MPKSKIKELSQRVKIPYLIHFTRAENLPSILKCGICPVSKFHEINTTPSTNDALRLDGHLDGISISIAFPNSQMFYKYRMENPEVSWAVLVLFPSILWEKDCAFCKHNAADGRISCQPLDSLKTPQAFQELFSEIEGHKSRAEQFLKQFDPTDVQAEILVFDIIEQKYIACIGFDSSVSKEKYAEHAKDRQTFVHSNNQGLFSSRTYARQIHNLRDRNG